MATARVAATSILSKGKAKPSYSTNPKSEITINSHVGANRFTFP
jgi:hypothetical protein